MKRVVIIGWGPAGSAVGAYLLMRGVPTCCSRAASNPAPMSVSRSCRSPTREENHQEHLFHKYLRDVSPREILELSTWPEAGLRS